MIDPLSKTTNLARVEKLVQESSLNAKVFFDFMCECKWKLAGTLLREGTRKGHRYQILSILQKVTYYVLSDSFDEVKKPAESSALNNKQPLANITNSELIKREPSEINSILNNKRQKLPGKSIKAFTKVDGLAIIHNDIILRGLTGNSSIGLTRPEERTIILEMLNDMCKLAHAYKKRQIYDCLAEKLLYYGVYKEALEAYVNCTDISPEEELHAVRVFELAATSPSGVIQLNAHLDIVLDIIRKVLLKQTKIQDQDDVGYSAITVLLDLTANESCLERVAKYMMQFSMFESIFAELGALLAHGASITGERNRKCKDLLIGIVLNLACNVESEEIQLLFIEKNIIPILATVLYDCRNDWPSNGSALALLQYSHKSLTNINVYYKITEARIPEMIEHYMTIEGSLEAKRSINEALVLLSIADKKQKSVLEILTKYVIAAPA